MKDDSLSLLDVLQLVRDCSSQEWQEADGSRKGATDNSGKRMWFITESVMEEVRAAIVRATGGKA